MTNTENTFTAQYISDLQRGQTNVVEMILKAIKEETESQIFEDITLTYSYINLSLLYNRFPTEFKEFLTFQRLKFYMPAVLNALEDSGFTYELKIGDYDEPFGRNTGIKLFWGEN